MLSVDAYKGYPSSLYLAAYTIFMK